jgi:uncharacterized protein YecE (DUF72 family)
LCLIAHITATVFTRPLLTYSDEEGEEWLPRIRQLDEESGLTLVYMNNHWQVQAVRTARQLRMLMEGAE